MAFRITIRQTQLLVEVRASSITFTVETGKSANIAVREDQFTVTATAPLSVPLSGQGPDLIGEPTLHSGDRRPDGTLITATVPHPRPRR